MHMFSLREGYATRKSNKIDQQETKKSTRSALEEIEQRDIKTTQLHSSNHGAKSSSEDRDDTEK